MDFNDYSIDAILAENQKVQCKFKQKIPNMGIWGITQNAKLQMPVWLSYIILYSLQRLADLVFPAPFGQRVHNALKAEPRSVRLSGLVGLLYSIQGSRAKELSEMMTDAFTTRLMEVVDQAYHFANGSMTGVSAAGTPQAFREGLDNTERELFLLARNSEKASKEWYDGGNHRAKPI
ncbi:hypothetical protein JOM56_009750 [Amanita muscaria]